jgi:hypothetical protein
MGHGEKADLPVPERAFFRKTTLFQTLLERLDSFSGIKPSYLGSNQYERKTFDKTGRNPKQNIFRSGRPGDAG